MIPHRRTFQLVVVALALAALWLMTADPAGAQAPQVRCRPGALLVAQTTPPTYARCTDAGLWRAIPKKDYDRLLAAQQARQAINRKGR